ncbi:MAG TPA: SDR family oxidoreductase [Dehalococcoidia bacterium]|nr:SDR family oxidoreductase [Dehalococcoidia bacterium]
MPESLSGQVAIVTGGGRGFGQAIALGLAQAGAAVAVTSRTPAQLDETVAQIEAVGGRAIALPADVTAQSDVERVVAETQARLGPIDLLVSNAALSDPVGPIWEIDPDVWGRTLETNVMGTLRICNAAMKGMAVRGRGRVIVVSSGAGLFAGPYDSSYRVSKTALIRLAEIMAIEGEAAGIKVFSIHPGVLSTTLHHSATLTEAGRKYIPEFAERAERGASDPALAAACCIFLATGAADALSGRYLSATDDFRALAARAAEIKAQNLQVLKFARG